MELSAKYNPSEIENKWYQFWLENKYFSSKPDHRVPYTIVIPPPNVTGVLHMGHMLNNTIQDVLIRRARMQGFNACWVPGTDHASIATEAKVVQLLQSQGIKKSDLTRDEFLKHAWDWKEKYGGIILDQLKRLGSSCDWDRTRFTMEPKLSDAVSFVFIDLYNKGLVYRGTRMVNWDPQGKTTLSDEEVKFKEVQDSLYFVKYEGVDFDGFLQVATARPETIAGDVAVCVHPEDERYAALIGKKVRVPLINREIEIISDTYIDKEFGTGVLKVTPAHDIHDYEIGLKFKLPVIDTLNDDGTISEAGVLFVGQDRFEARKNWVGALNESELLIKVEEYTHNVGFSERTDAVVEPKISTQWFLDMKKFMDQNPEILSSVMNDEVHFHPEKLKNTYKHWMENIRDWNISRQLWWGHRIPAFYDQEGDFVVADSIEKAIEEFAKKGKTRAISDLKQDEDVLDTWFSSWLWPISVFDGFESQEEVDYYYPTNDLVTGPDIMFFWVARMIMAGYEFRQEKPFKNVYFTGILRDKLRRKMSKSLGNSPDALKLIDDFGADAVRLGMLLCAPAGNDILFDESQIEQGRNFCNKIWNAFRLYNSWTGANITTRPYELESAKWFENRVNQVLTENEKHFEAFRLSDALMNLYKLIWDDFCSVYLEGVKPKYGEQISEPARIQTQHFFSQLMKAIHPFLPFISEEIYHVLWGDKLDKPCVISEYPQSQNSATEFDSDLVLQAVSEVRNLRAQKQLSPKIELKTWMVNADPSINAFSSMLEKLANIELQTTNRHEGNFIMLLVKQTEIWIEIEQEINIEEECAKIEKEIGYLKGFLKSIDAKLLNEKFMANAKPDVIEREKQKYDDAQSKINNFEIQLKALRS